MKSIMLSINTIFHLLFVGLYNNIKSCFIYDVIDEEELDREYHNMNREILTVN
jgi:hypothetical protein